MDNIRLVTILPATPEDLYDAWLSSLGHTAMTGAPATTEARVGSRHTAWNGYISGEHVELEPGRRILQTWRTTEFPETSPDSLLEIVLTEDGDGTRITLIQNGIPDGQGEKYHEGWQDHYFAPMYAYFSAMRPAGAKETRPRAAAAAAKKSGPPRAKASAKKAAVKASAKKAKRPAQATAAAKKAAAKSPARAAKKAKKAKKAKSARTATPRAKSAKKAKASGAVGAKKGRKRAKKGRKK
ncbi:MAG TPA: SRPBCC domain-containing protein [Polyangiaceae bacterium]|jgi:uncharacterized protein YndB with AHSA1/START domain|nr:SRPBCC domain-containing protein [Polyangiaceae bacterium]